MAPASTPSGIPGVPNCAAIDGGPPRPTSSSLKKPFFGVPVLGDRPTSSSLKNATSHSYRAPSLALCGGSQPLPAPRQTIGPLGVGYVLPISRSAGFAGIGTCDVSSFGAGGALTAGGPPNCEAM